MEVPRDTHRGPLPWHTSRAVLGQPSWGSAKGLVAVPGPACEASPPSSEPGFFAGMLRLSSLRWVPRPYFPPGPALGSAAFVGFLG